MVKSRLYFNKGTVTDLVHELERTLPVEIDVRMVCKQTFTSKRDVAHAAQGFERAGYLTKILPDDGGYALYRSKYKIGWK